MAKHVRVKNNVTAQKSITTIAVYYVKVNQCNAPFMTTVYCTCLHDIIMSTYNAPVRRCGYTFIIREWKIC